jgi:hypothetical protein
LTGINLTKLKKLTEKKAMLVLLPTREVDPDMIEALVLLNGWKRQEHSIFYWAYGKQVSRYNPNFYYPHVALHAAAHECNVLTLDEALVFKKQMLPRWKALVRQREKCRDKFSGPNWRLRP